MKKLVLISAAVAAISAASAVTPANALTIIKPGCCGGFNPGGGGFHPHWGGGFGGGISVGLVGLDSGYGVGGSGDCYYVRRKVLVPNIGLVNRRQLVCE